MERQLQQCLLIERLRRIGVENSGADRRAPQGCRVHATSIIAQHHTQAITSAEDRKRHTALVRLAGRAPCGGLLDPVRDGVAYEVPQRADEAIEQPAIQSKLAALDL